MSPLWRSLLTFALVISVSCSSPIVNGDEGQLSIESSELTAGCPAHIFVGRTEKDALPTSCSSCEGHSSPLIRLTGASGVLMGCEQGVHGESAVVRSITCNGEPCPSAVLVRGQVDFTPAASGPLLVRVLAEVDGDELEDTRTFQIDGGPCPALAPIKVPRLPDASFARCRPDAPFRQPAPVPVVGGAPQAAHPSVGGDKAHPETRLAFDMATDGGRKVFVATGSPRTFGDVLPLGAGDGTWNDYEPSFTSSLDFPLVFASDRGDAGGQLFASLVDGGVTPILGAESDAQEGHPFVHGESLWFASDRDGDWEIYRTALDGATASAVIHVNELGSPYFDGYPVLSSDGLTVFFASDRPNALRAGVNVWTAIRRSDAAPFDTPVLVAELARNGDDVPGWLSEDGCDLYLTHILPGLTALTVAQRGR